MIGESCKNVAATGECTHYYNAFRTLISVAMPHARATNKSKVETWRRVSDWPRLDRVPRRGCGGSPGAGFSSNGR